MTHGKTYNKSPRRINHKATSKFDKKKKNRMIFQYRNGTSVSEALVLFTNIEEDIITAFMYATILNIK